MQCPKCGAENRDDAQICASCSCSLAVSSATATDSKPKTSKMSIGSALLAGLAAALMYFVHPTLAFIAALSGIFTAIASIAEIRKSKGKLVGKSIAIAVVALSTVEIVLLSYWRIDAPPIPNDYTISDIRCAPPECRQTYELLNSLADEDGNLPGAPAIGLSAQDLDHLEEINRVFKKEAAYTNISAGLDANAENILRIWQNARKGRDVIAKLGTFPEIADLTQPFIEYELACWVKNVRSLVHLHRAYSCLQSCQGKERVAIDELISLDSIFRKLSLNARSLVTKLVCFASFQINIKTANFIANNPHTSEDSLRTLVEHFGRPSADHLCLRNSIIFEYLILKNELSRLQKHTGQRYSSFSPVKPNSTLRHFRNFCDSWIALEQNHQQIKELSVWPAVYPNLPVTIDSDGNLPWYYKAYNPIGSMLIRILTPALGKVCEIKTNTEIRCDLLQIVLNKRLGNQVSLKARAYSDEYIVDIENKRILSPGLDGKAGTKDDIKLPINPEVLGFSD